MMNETQIESATLQQLNAELAAAGWDSGQTSEDQARDDVRTMIAGTLTTTFRTDGLDNPMSPNGAHPLYYVLTDAGKKGPYSCTREAELAKVEEDDIVIDHTGREVE